VRGAAACRCNTLIHTATHCNTLIHTATHCHTLRCCGISLQHTATHSSVAVYRCKTHCYALQHTATHCSVAAYGCNALLAAAYRRCAKRLISPLQLQLQLWCVALCSYPGDVPRHVCVCVHACVHACMCVCGRVCRQESKQTFEKIHTLSLSHSKTHFLQLRAAQLQKMTIFRENDPPPNTRTHTVQGISVSLRAILRPVASFRIRHVHTATNTLHHTHCNTHTARHLSITAHGAAARCLARNKSCTHCNTLQHTATHCNALQHTATHCNTPAARGAAARRPRPRSCGVCVCVCRRERSCGDRVRAATHFLAAAAAVCCSVLQCVAGCCRVLQ